MKLLSYISIILIFASCQKNEAGIVNLNNNRIDVLGHAGMGISSLYPIDSKESLLACLNSGANGTELDLQLTKDNILVAFHDPELSQKTNLSGTIRELTWEELSQGYYTTTQYLTYKIMRVSDLFEYTENYHNYIFTFDIKLFPSPGEEFQSYIDDYTDVLKQMYTAYQLHSSTFMEIQSTDFIELMQLKDPQIRLFIYPQIYENGLAIAQNYNLFGITISNENISNEQIKEAHDLGFFVTTWGVHNKQENKNAVAKFPDMIQTDKLDFLISYLE